MKKLFYIFPLSLLTLLFAIVPFAHASSLWETPSSVYVMQGNSGIFPFTNYAGLTNSISTICINVKNDVYPSVNTNQGFNFSVNQSGLGAILAFRFTITSDSMMTQHCGDVHDMFVNQYGNPSPTTIDNSFPWFNYDGTIKATSVRYIQLVGSSSTSFALSSVTTYTDSVLNLTLGTDGTNNVPTISFNYVATPPLAILTPQNGTSLVAGIYQVSGTCPVVATNELAFTTDIVSQQSSLTYDIECKSDNTFTFKKTLDQYLTKFYIVEKTTHDFVLTSFSISATAYQNSLKVLYPPAFKQDYYKVQPSSTFPFRFEYNLANGQNDVYYHLRQCSTQAFSLCTTILSENKIDESVPYFDLPIPVPEGTEQFYRLTITGYNGTPNYTSIQFTTLGVNDSTLPGATLPPDIQGCTNPLCALFVPRQGFTGNMVENTSNLMHDKVPFAYYYQLKDSFSSLPTSGASDSPIVINAHIASTAMPTIQMKFFDFANQPQLQTNLDLFKTVMSYMLWFGFAFWLFRKSFSIFKM